MKNLRSCLLVSTIVVGGVISALVGPSEVRSQPAKPTVGAQYQYVGLAASGANAWFIDSTRNRLYHCIAASVGSPVCFWSAIDEIPEKK